MYDIQTTYAHRIWLANVVPITLLCVSSVALTVLKSRPSIGDLASRPVGQVMTNESMERDWLPLTILKTSNMAMYFLLPTVRFPSYCAMSVWSVVIICALIRCKPGPNPVTLAYGTALTFTALAPPQIVKVYASSFHCTEFDVGAGQDPDLFMSASLTVDCKSSEYEEIKVLAIASLLIVPTFILVMFYFMVTPVVSYIESRTKRTGVAPSIDFLIAKWRPDHWYFSFFDMVRVPPATAL